MSKYKHPTLAEFMEGATIEYPAAKGRNKVCGLTKVSDDTVAINPPSGAVEFVTVEPTRMAALYYNLTRKKHVAQTAEG